MSDRVLEVKALAEVTIHLPLEDGDEMKRNAEEALQEDGARWVDCLDIKEAYTMEEY